MFDHGREVIEKLGMGYRILLGGYKCVRYTLLKLHPSLSVTIDILSSLFQSRPWSLMKTSNQLGG
jgi:hypothetical protein